jgi:hypothetical protein
MNVLLCSFGMAPMRMDLRLGVAAMQPEWNWMKEKSVAAIIVWKRFRNF